MWRVAGRRFPIDVLYLDFVGKVSLGCGIRAAECGGVRRVLWTGNHDVSDPFVSKTSLRAQDSVCHQRVADLAAFFQEYRGTHENACVARIVHQEPCESSVPEYLASIDALPESLLLVIGPDLVCKELALGAEQLRHIALVDDYADVRLAAAPTALVSPPLCITANVTSVAAVAIYHSALAYYT
ncbi:hypothetical protein DIPPA_19450 [Diplonema papillatum]|nr:hypothetical protein DIPPA_19450 [Diplonema papillatum]|eukprot:gene15185-23194_t